MPIESKNIKIPNHYKTAFVLALSDNQKMYYLRHLLMKINQLLGKTVIVVTHEMELVERFGHRVITLDEGKIGSDINIETAAAEFEDAENTGGENE